MNWHHPSPASISISFCQFLEKINIYWTCLWRNHTYSDCRIGVLQTQKTCHFKNSSIKFWQSVYGWMWWSKFGTILENEVSVRVSDSLEESRCGCNSISWSLIKSQSNRFKPFQNEQTLQHSLCTPSIAKLFRSIINNSIWKNTIRVWDTTIPFSRQLRRVYVIAIWTGTTICPS